MIKEVWKEIPGLPGYYQVSNLGRVVSLKHGVFYYKIYKYKTGYCYVCIERKKYKVHRLVALAFIPNPDNLPQINHKNELKCDNRAENLEWCTAKYNVNYGTSIERRSRKRGKKVYCKETGQIYNSCKAAAKELNLDFSHIAKCCRGILVHHKNYHFQYI